jgi:hypothetical protein
MVVLMDRTSYLQERPAIGDMVALHLPADAITLLDAAGDQYHSTLTDS